MDEKGEIGRPEPALDAADIVRLLSEPDRLRVCAALVLGSRDRAEVGAATGLAGRQLDRALGRLLAAGLVTRSGERLELVTEHLVQASRAAAPPDHVEMEGSSDRARVLRSFVRNGRLTSIPVVRSKRLVVLDWLAQRFDPGRHYREREVNQILSEVHPDAAALRRYLVDEGLMGRHAGEYWRTGGTFEVG